MAKSPFSINRFRIIFILGWLIVIADNIFLLRWFGLSWKTAAVDSLVNGFHLIMASLLIINMLRYYLPRRERVVHLLVLCLILTGAILLLTNWALSNFFRTDDAYIAFLSDSMIIRGSLDFLLLGCVTLITVIWYIWQDQKEIDFRNQDAEKLSKEAELFKLRQQLQPHFLFNSLNSINALIGSRPEEARKMVHQLSDFLRGTIRKEDHQWVSLKEELEYLQLYLEIEKVRFGHRLFTKIEIDETCEEKKLPALLLQPIMENAIKFGLYDTTGETAISLSATCEENYLLIIVKNPFDQETSAPRQGTGFGLQSIQRRLYLLFARTDLVKTEVLAAGEEGKENIFITTVKIPQL